MNKTVMNLKIILFVIYLLGANKTENSLTDGVKCHILILLVLSKCKDLTKIINN